MEKIENNPK